MGRRAQTFYQALHGCGKTHLSHRFDKIIERLSFECSNGELIKGGEEYHLRHALRTAPSDHLKAIYPRHLNVTENDIRCGNIQSREDLDAIATLRGNTKLRKCRQQMTYTPARCRFIVSNYDSPFSAFHDSTPGSFRDTA